MHVSLVRGGGLSFEIGLTESRTSSELVVAVVDKELLGLIGINGGIGKVPTASSSVTNLVKSGSINSLCCVSSLLAVKIPIDDGVAPSDDIVLDLGNSYREKKGQ